MKNVAIIVLLVGSMLFGSIPVFAHSGRTDSKGGHWNRSTGTYHYHNGGGSSGSMQTQSSFVYPSSIDIYERHIFIDNHQSYQIEHNVSPVNADTWLISWESSNEDVAIALPGGSLLILGNGDSTITASCDNGIMDTVMITVSDGKGPNKDHIIIEKKPTLDADIVSNPAQSTVPSQTTEPPLSEEYQLIYADSKWLMKESNTVIMEYETGELAFSISGDFVIVRIPFTIESLTDGYELYLSHKNFKLTDTDDGTEYVLPIEFMYSPTVENGTEKYTGEISYKLPISCFNFVLDYIPDAGIENGETMDYRFSLPN